MCWFHPGFACIPAHTEPGGEAELTLKAAWWRAASLALRDWGAAGKCSLSASLLSCITTTSLAWSDWQVAKQVDYKWLGTQREPGNLSAEPQMPTGVAGCWNGFSALASCCIRTLLFSPCSLRSFAISESQMEVEQGQADKLGMEAERALDLQARSSLLPITQPLNHEPIGPFSQQKFPYIFLIQFYTFRPPSHKFHPSSLYFSGRRHPFVH